MHTLYLIRHSLTEANEKHLYCGWTDLSLTEAGRALAKSIAESRPLPVCDRYASSGLKRTSETLELLTGHRPDIIYEDLREMHFGAFEMFAYDQLVSDPRYIQWIEDTTQTVSCPGGESQYVFHQRVTRCADNLLSLPIDSLLVLCHGGVIANLMAHYFPAENRNFYQWQPSACRGYALSIVSGRPARFEPI